MTGAALYFDGDRTVERRAVDVGEPEDDELLIGASVSAISPGTELLVYRGDVPDSLSVDPTIDALDGQFDFPLQYGYALVGTVEGIGDDVDGWSVGDRAFAFAPHQTRVTVGADKAVPLPPSLPSAHAGLLPTVETAVNLVLDGEPAVGERVVVFGAGPVGLATAHVLAGFPLDELVVVEPIERRRELARSVGADTVIEPAVAGSHFEGRCPPGADLAIELSGRPETLDDAIDAVGYGGRIVLGSWYGTKRAPVNLGGAFHRNDVTIQASQVSTVAPERRGRWSADRRLDVAIDRLLGLDADPLITHRIPFDRAEEAYRLLDDETDALQVLLTYDR